MLQCRAIHSPKAWYRVALFEMSIINYAPSADCVHAGHFGSFIAAVYDMIT